MYDFAYQAYRTVVRGERRTKRKKKSPYLPTVRNEGKGEGQPTDSHLDLNFASGGRLLHDVHRRAETLRWWEEVPVQELRSHAVKQCIR